MKKFLKYGAGMVTLALLLLAGGFYAWGEMSLAKLAYSSGRTITKVRRTDGAREVLAQWDLT